MRLANTFAQDLTEMYHCNVVWVEHTNFKSATEGNSLSPSNIMQELTTYANSDYTCPAIQFSNYFLSGDYCGSTYHTANRNVILEQFPDSCTEVYYAFGAIDLVFFPHMITEELLDTIGSLEDYPVLDDDEWSRVENELELEAWETWVGADYQKELEDIYNVDLDDVEDPNSLFGLFNCVCEHSNIYWQTEGNDRTIDVEDAATYTDTADLIQFGFKAYPSLNWDYDCEAEIAYAQHVVMRRLCLIEVPSSTDVLNMLVLVAECNGIEIERDDELTTEWIDQVKHYVSEFDLSSFNFRFEGTQLTTEDI